MCLLELPQETFFDFLQGEEEGGFSIYVHSRPGFLFNKATTQSAYFYGRQVNNSIQVSNFFFKCGIWCPLFLW